MKNDLTQVYYLDANGNNFLGARASNKEAAQLLLKMFNRLVESSFFKEHPVDGYFVFWDKNSKLIKWKFFNRDGSPAGICGNAGRALAKLALVRSQIKSLQSGNKTYTLKRTKDGKSWLGWELRSIKKKRFSSNIRKKIGSILGLPEKKTKNSPSSVNQVVDYIHSGVPHIVLRTKPSRSRAKRLRAYELTPKKLHNITFYEIVGPHSVRIQTFERGVENFTRACGSGIIAVAYKLLKTGIWNDLRDLAFMTPGGIILCKIEKKPRHPPKIFISGDVKIKKLGDLLL